MKIAFIATLLVTASALAQTASATQVAGKWKMLTSMCQESDLTCTFIQQGTDLSGVCEGDSRKFAATGKVDGKMVGTNSVGEMSLNGPFTAVKDAPAH